MLLHLLIGVLLLPDSSQNVAQEVCHTNSSIGSNVQMNLSNPENVGHFGQFYLNIAEPAHCNGTVTSVDYCYYGPSQYGDFPFWAAAVALYHSEAADSYRRVSDGILLSKHAPSDPLLPNPETDLLLNFNCDTYVLNSTMHVQEGDIFGALVIVDLTWWFLRLGGLDLVGDSSDGYLMMNKFLDQREEIRDLATQVLTDVRMGKDVDLPQTLDGLSLDKVKRVLHVYANIKSDPSVIASIRPSITATTNTPDGTVAKNEISDNVTSSSDREILTQPPISMEGLSQIITIVGVLGAIVIIGILISIAIVLAILHRRIRKQPQVSTKQTINLKNSSANECDLNALGNMEMEAYSEPIDQRTVPFTTELNEYAVVGPNTSKAEHGTMEDDHFYFVLDHFYFVLEGPKCPYTELLEKNKTEDIYEHVTRYHEPAKQERDLYSQIKSFGIKHIDRNSIQIQNQVLGSGQFGSVKSGIWKTEKSEVKVAVKSLNQGISEETRVKFLQEATIMAQFRHPNVAFLYGVVIEGEPIMLVVELVEKGDLRKCLMSIKSNPGEISSDDLPNLLLSFSQHVALGMQYLSGKGFVHRDLAARNILVSKDSVCKVADFGMSRDLADENYYVSHGGMIPVKWTAPEAIHYKKYSTASDVWSYGCLLYEIWSLAFKPFENISNLEVIRMLDKGERLAPLSGSPRIIYELMIQCWHPTVTSRPSFRELVLTLTGDKRQVLLIPQRDGDTHPLARVLGAPLEAGKNMYKDLQNRYIIL